MTVTGMLWRRIAALIFVATVVFFAIAVRQSLSSAQESNALLQECQRLTKLLPANLQTLEMTDCERPENSQTYLLARYTVPADRVSEVEALLVSGYGMQPLRFVCCHYETQPIGLNLPEQHLLREGTSAGAIRGVTLRFGAPAFLEDTTELKELGALDGEITLRLIDA